jgi:hypothetical protein
MSKIRILTYHNNENGWAILQAYSLCKALSELFFKNVEKVEYRTKANEQSRRNGCDTFEIPSFRTPEIEWQPEIVLF